MEDLVYLGLEYPRDTGENPLILSSLSSFLEREIQKNEIMFQGSPTEDIITIFHGLRAPSLSIQQYIDRIFKYSCCSPSCFVAAHIYLDRYIQQTQLCLTSLNIHRLLITSIVVAAKFMDDVFFKNSYYARVGGISTGELNELELKFLFTLDFRLFVSVQTFMKYCSLLKSEAGRMPVKTCGSERSWAIKDESACAQSISR